MAKLPRLFSPVPRGSAVPALAAAALAAGLLVTPAGGAIPAAGAAHGSAAPATLPARGIERIVGAQGRTDGGVLEVDQDRSDLDVSGPPGVRYAQGFQIRNELYFQSAAGGQAIFNGDVALRQDEIQPVIDAIGAQHLTLQAEHQHLYDLTPMVWFVHFRGVGEPLRLAARVRAVLRATHTPLPQRQPSHPGTPLPAQRIARVLGGTAGVGENGVVSVTVPRTDRVELGGRPVRPMLGVSTEIQFQPLPGGRAVAVPDIAMTSGEVGPVISVMRAQGWEVGCLYNQEIGETPQLYFSHLVKSGDPLALASQIRTALDRTRAAHGS